MSEPGDDVKARARQRVGSTLKDKWKLDALLGVGGMAAVYRATHRNRKTAAIKMLHAEYSANPEMRARFLREGYLANSVGHPAVVSVHDDDIAEDGSAFLVMDLLEGESVDERSQRKGGCLPLSEVLSVADQLLEVLVVAHEKDIVHRDIKPDNLFLTNDGTLRVLDFGIARVRELGSPSSTTQEGSLLGTPSFMAPEQARGRWSDVDSRTDLWAVAATMFYLLSGRPVHDAETPNEVIALAITQRPPQVATLLPELPACVAKVIDRGLSYEKEARFQDAREMREAVWKAHAEITGGASARPPMLSIADGVIRVSETDHVSLRTGSGAVTSRKSDAVASAVTLTSQDLVDASAGPVPARIRPFLRIALAAAALVVAGVALTVYRMGGAADPQTQAAPRANDALSRSGTQPPRPAAMEITATPMSPSALGAQPEGSGAPGLDASGEHLPAPKAPARRGTTRTRPKGAGAAEDPFAKRH
jgi:serine/threonine-protein kinase